MSSRLPLFPRRTARPALVSVTLGFGVLGLLALAPAASAQYYTVFNLTSLYSHAGPINDAGQFFTTNSAGESILAGPDGMNPVPYSATLDGISVHPSLINDSGQVAGGFKNAHGKQDVFVSGPDGSSLKNLGNLGGSTTYLSTYVNGINALGQVTGFAAVADNNTSIHAFLSSKDGTGPLKDLGTLPSAPNTYSNSFGAAVNDTGQVTGDSNGHAFISGVNGDGPLRDLGTLGGSFSSGNAINNSGQVAGESYINYAQTNHAFLSGANGGALKDLGTLVGPDGESLAEGVNDAGTVVGNSEVSTPDGPNFHAFIYSDGVMTDLNSLTSLPKGVILDSASQITNSGLILAKGHLPVSKYESDIYEFLLEPSSVNPVPEASTTVSFGLLLALGGVMIAKRKKASTPV